MCKVLSPGVFLSVIHSRPAARRLFLASRLESPATLFRSIRQKFRQDLDNQPLEGP